MPTYGQNGDRWWVAYNTSQQDHTAIGTSVGNPFSTTPSGYESLPSGNAADDAKFAAAALLSKASPQAAGKGPTISVENITWANVNGPYSSQSAANAAIPGIQSKNPAPGAVQQATGFNPSTFSSIQNALSAFYDKLTDGKMWRSLGWILLGILLIFIGLALLGVPYFVRKSPAAFAAKAVGNA